MKKNPLLHLKRISVLLILFLLKFNFQTAAQCSANYTVNYDTSGTVLTFLPTWTSSSTVVNMLWTFGDGTSAVNQNPTHTYNITGYAVVCLTISFADSCQASFCDSVATRQGSVLQCMADFNYANLPAGVSFTDQSSSFDPIVSYSWDFGDGTTGSTQNPVHGYTFNGNYYVCLTITSSSACSDTYCTYVSVQNSAVPCQADFTVTPILGTTLVNFTDASVADSGATITSYFWDFDSIGSSTLQNPSYPYPSTGTYYTCLTIQTSSGCSSTHCEAVTVGNSNFCNAGFNYSFNPGTNAFDFVDNSNSLDSIIRWEWDFGDGTTSMLENPSHNFAASGYYNVCLTITSGLGCVSTYCSNVHNFGPQNCSAAFSGTVTPSNLGLFYCTYTNALANYIWSFGDGTSSTILGGAQVTHQYSVPGTYLVCLFVQDSTCQDSSCNSFTVGTSAICSALYTFTVDSTGNEFTFTNQSSAATTYFWSFGDGTAGYSVNPVHLYNSPGPHTVCLTVTDSTNGCQDTFCNSVSAANACNPVFTAVPDTTNPNGVPMTFNIISPCGTPSSVIIDYGDGTVLADSSILIPYTYSTPGTYNVCVCEVINGDTLCFCDTIVAYRLSSGISEFELSNVQLNAYPNPFSSTLNAEFNLERSALVSIQLVGIAGNVVQSVATSQLSSGNHKIEIKTDNLSSGFYILKLNLNGNSISKKVVLQK